VSPAVTQPRFLVLVVWLGALTTALVALHLAEIPAGSPNRPETTAFAGLRLMALALGWYLAVATSLAILVRVAGVPRRWAVAADRLTVAGVRSLVRAAGLGATSAALTVGPHVAHASGTVLRARAPEQHPPDTVVMRRLPDDQPAPVTGAWVVAPGEHFWLAARRTLEAAWGRAPDVAQTAAYWRTLIDANRDRLVRSGHPDLVRPGQVFVLPPAPPAPPG
jgi:nucleoid-associated protein YgaU